MRMTLLAALAVVAGCAAPLVPHHPTRTAAEAKQDEMECDLRAREATASMRNAFEQAFERQGIRDQCMRVRGYTFVQPPR